MIFVTTHWSACVWRLIVNFELTGEETIEDAEHTWVYAHLADSIANGEPAAGPADLYVTCLYWAVTTTTTIGYGDAANPQTTLERLVAMASCVFVLFLSSSLILFSSLLFSSLRCTSLLVSSRLVSSRLVSSILFFLFPFLFFPFLSFSFFSFSSFLFVLARSPLVCARRLDDPRAASSA